MKKVIAALTAIVVLILGTAIGMVVNASHLRKKERVWRQRPILDQADRENNVGDHF